MKKIFYSRASLEQRLSIYLSWRKKIQAVESLAAAAGLLVGNQTEEKDVVVNVLAGALVFGLAGLVKRLSRRDAAVALVVLSSQKVSVLGLGDVLGKLGTGGLDADHLLIDAAIASVEARGS